MNDVLTHELIHAYDFARVKYDVYNLRHLACTEVNVSVKSYIRVRVRNPSPVLVNDSLKS